MLWDGWPVRLISFYFRTAKFYKYYIIFKNLCVCVYVCMHAMCVGACSGQKKVFNPLKLEFQAVMSCQMWVLGIVLRASKSSK